MTSFSCPDPCRLLVTCEHARNRVPRPCRYLFAGREELLATHRAYDPGALELARSLAASFSADLFATAVTRLLVDCNRSESNPRLFARFARELDRDGREFLLARYYRPHLRAVTGKAKAVTGRGLLLVHVGVHTFTPELNGRIRRADIGLLYDPARKEEKEFCRSWKAELKKQDPDLHVRRNYPYLGKTDGLPAMLRKTFSSGRYIGIELEISQRLCSGTKAASLPRTLARSLHRTLHAFCSGRADL